jgi:RNA polymerase sigma-70 factor, ECF subfamily
MFRESTFDLRGERAIDETDFFMDEETFRRFYDRTARGLWVYLARVTGDRQLADDLLQETFFRFLCAGTRYDTEAHRRNSLYRIATNLAHDNRRRSLARLTATVTGSRIESTPARPASSTPEQITDLTRAMERLNPRERSMLWLAYAEGASHEEIAAVLNLRPTSMKALLFRARGKLASLLGRTQEEKS